MVKMDLVYQRNDFNGKSPWRYNIGTVFKCQDLKFNRAKLVLCDPLNSRTITIAALCLSYWRGNCDCLCK